MDEILSKSWWVLALRGVIAILFGVLAFAWPGLTLLGLVALFAAYALLGGIVSVFGAVRHKRQHEDWGVLLLLGVAAIVAGVIAIIHPGVTAVVLVLLMGANALVSGVLDIVSGIRLRKAIRGEWMLILSGVASVVFGVLVFLFPAAGALALVWLISIYAVVTGILLLAAAFQLRSRAANRAAGMSDRRVTPDRRMTPSQPRPA